ncbi:methyltransferase [Aureococcus anophagefferens]|nr:methyltransferase [Aureococcus anophagefferens]
MAAAIERDYGAADYWERRYYAEPPPLDLYLGYEDRASAAPPPPLRRQDRLEYREADCRDLRARRKRHDPVLDKALFDCVLCGSQNLSGVALMTAGAFRVLKPGGASSSRASPRSPSAPTTPAAHVCRKARAPPASLY